jgi:hypothetical protein
MKKNLLSLTAILSIGFFTSNVEAQTSAKVTGTTAGAKLIQPMTLTQTSPLHFGTINVLTGAGGTVLLPSNNAAGRVFGTGVAASTVDPQPTNAAYNVLGTKNTTYALVLPSTITVVETQSSESMTIGLLKARFKDALGDAITSKLSQTGTDSFTVGGTLTVAASQTPGVYAGTFDVTVDYN